LSTFSGAVFTILFLGLGRGDVRGKAANPGPVWKLDARALGIAAPTPRTENAGKALYIDPVCFLDNETVVVTFVTREAVTELPRRGESQPSLPFRLHALFTDTKTAQVRTTREWPTAHPHSRVLGGKGGRFIVLTPDRLIQIPRAWRCSRN
jgi:hypothetical protein